MTTETTSSISVGGDGAPTPILEVKGLVTEFHQARGTLSAVDGVSYYLNRGEIVAFVGESGSGKSVTQYSTLQLLPMPPGKIAGGEIWYEGENLLDFPQSSPQLREVRGGEIGVVFQEPMTSLNPVLTIGRQLTEGVMLHRKLSQKSATELAEKMLRQVGIPDPGKRLGDYPHQFSGGMRQRIMIAMALMCDPKILIADEATTALDVTTQAQILELMQGLVRERNSSLVIVTHNLGIVARYASRVYVMYAGMIVESGTTDEIFHNPRHPYTIGLIRAVPSLSDPKERRLIPIEGMVPNLLDRPSYCAFANRCPFATDECFNSPVPRLRGVGEGHEVACLREITTETVPEREVGPRELIPIRRQANEGTPVLSVEDLVVSFPAYGGFLRRKVGEVTAVDRVSFEVLQGETLGLVGESGCGKTTIARAVMRLNEVKSGKISFKEEDITDMSPAQLRSIRRDMTMVFQDPYGSLDPRQTAGGIVEEPLVNYCKDLNRSQRDQRVNELMEMVGLSPDVKDRLPHEFSGGQRQRLAIARALATDPDLIVLDEAISALDVSIQSQVINLLEDLQRRLGVSYLFIAHDLSVVRHISDRVAVMYLGQLVEVAGWEELYGNPLHPYTKALLEAVPIPDPRQDRSPQRIIKGEVPSPMNRPSGCAFSNRCPIATEICKTETPTLLSRGKGHRVACFNVGGVEE